MNTISFTQRPDGSFFSIDEINALLVNIKSVLDAKIDRRGIIMLGDLKIRDGGIINVPVAINSGDVVGTIS